MDDNTQDFINQIFDLDPEGHHPEPHHHPHHHHPPHHHPPHPCPPYPHDKGLAPAPSESLPMKLEAVVTCVNYGDFLSHTLPLNKCHFNRLVVVTSHMDKLTQRICEYHHVQCIQTDKFQAHLGRFCKGAGINVGLDALDKDGWLVHMDADIVCPPLTRKILEAAELDVECIYGPDRFMVPSFEEWSKFISHPRLQHENKSWIHLNSFPVGTRVAIEEYGWAPIGFFQLWHGSKAIRYPEGHLTAAREDLHFPIQWPRNKRHLLSELVVYHLESEKSAMGANWEGRTTKPFELGLKEK